MSEIISPDKTHHEKTIEDLINDVSSVHLSALLRAAKVSPSIQDGRTIGPLYENSSAKNVENLIKSKNINQTKLSNYVETKNNFSQHFTSLSPKNNLLDLNVINTSVIAKITEKSRRDNVKKELEIRLNNLTAENKKRKDELVKAIQSKNDWIQHKIESDIKINEIANKYVEDEIKQSNNKTENILKEKQRRLQAIALEAIYQRRKKFTSHYEKVCQLLKFEKNTVQCEDYNKHLKELATDFEKLTLQIKNNNIGQSEILISEALCERIKILEIKLNDDISKSKLQTLQESNVQEQSVQPITNVQSTQEQKEIQPIPVQSQNSIQPDTTDGLNVQNQFVSYETLNFYSELITFFNEKLQLIAPLENDPNMKKFLAACRRNINIPIAAVCAVSPQHMQDKFDKIMNFILGNTKKQSSSDIHISEHPLAKDYCIRYLAKKFIAVAGTEICSNVGAAFPFASLIIAIWNRVPEFGKLLLGQMYTESIFLVPLLFPKSNFQSDVEYKIAFGYYVNDNALEDFSSYNKRQTGIVRLFAAILISYGRHDDKNHPFPIENGWKWLCNFINIKPEMHDICATVLVEFLQVAAYEMLNLYGRQFRKLLVIIQEQYLPKLDQIEDGKAASKGKLEQTLDLILKHNKIDKPQGIIEKNFW